MARFYTLGLLFTFLFGLARCQQLIPLSEFSPDFNMNLRNLQVGMKVYVAALMNDTSPLNNLVFVSGAESKTAYELSTSYQDEASGLKMPWILPVAQLTVMNSNNQTVTQSITGYLYVLTANQSSDNNFYVYEIFGDQHISRLNDQMSTIVVFPKFSITNGFPANTAVLSNIMMKETSSMAIYRGHPIENESFDDNISKRMFTNPIDQFGKRFFSNIEPLQIYYSACYIVSNGGISFRAQNIMGPSQTMATSATTTGLIMDDYFATNASVIYMPDRNYTGWTGFVITMKNVLSPVEVRIVDPVYGFAQNYTSAVPNRAVEVAFLGDAFYVTPSRISAAVYSFQYFQIQGDLITTTGLPTSSPATPPTRISTSSGSPPSTVSSKSTTTTTTTTTTRIPTTTTKITVSHSIFVSVMVFVLCLI